MATLCTASTELCREACHHNKVSVAYAYRPWTRLGSREYHADPAVVLLQEFIRVGYYVSTEYTDETLRDDPPDTPEVDK